MLKMHSIVFRKAALLVYDYIGSMKRAAKVLNISAASLCRWSKQLQPSPRQAKRSKISSAMEAVIAAHLHACPETTCLAIVQLLRDVFQCTVSRQLVHIIVKRLGFTRKRTRKRGTSARGDVCRQEFMSRLRAYKASNTTIVSIDESGFDQRCKPVYGYAPRGHPAIVKMRTCSDRRRLALLLAVDSLGGDDWTLTPGSVTGIAFANFVRSLRHPHGTVLLLDNASIHKTHAVRAAAAEMGFDMLFTPPYCPEFNPIELVFGVVKNDFYRLRYTDQFDTVDFASSVQACVQRKVVQQTILNCFRHVHSLVA